MEEEEAEEEVYSGANAVNEGGEFDDFNAYDYGGA